MREGTESLQQFLTGAHFCAQNALKIQIREIMVSFWLGDIKGAFWRPIDQDQVLTTWSGGRQNGLVLNLRSCDVTALQAIKSNINIY